jgi:hypothetical protein
VAWHEFGRVQPGLFACDADDQEEAVGFVCNFAAGFEAGCVLPYGTLLAFGTKVLYWLIDSTD